MARISGHQIQAVYQSNGGDHRIGQADGLADPLQLAGDPAGQLGGIVVEGKNLFLDNGCQEVSQLSVAHIPCETADHFHHGDSGDR
jgi:hypothetical protein